MFVLGQVHAIMEFWLRRKLRECRNTAYVQTVRSRGKPADWWGEYVEEFSNPPTQKAIKDAKKQGWYLKLASPLVRFVVLKLFLLPIDFVPLFGMALGAALRSLSYGRQLHTALFEAKRMSPLQIELWITERQTAYRSFGFAAALMERIPLVGMVFSISNRIGAAMWAHDLEKRQQRIRASSLSSDAQQLQEFKTKPTLKKIYKQVQAGEAEGQFNGEGLAVLRAHKGAAMFTHLSFTFPLKLISPAASSRIASLATAKAVAALYIVGYGGGLVSGDSVELDMDVGQGACAVVLTQGSTKVFKTRATAPTRHVSTMHTAGPDATSAARVGVGVGGMTRQVYRYLIRADATLVLLPDPVTCFAAARYDQVQRFDLRSSTSSLVMLDWITPGRTAVCHTPHVRVSALDAFPEAQRGAQMKDYTTPPRLPERWKFDSYRSRNEVRLPDHSTARDVLLLEQHADRDHGPEGVGWTELARRNCPYDTYATLLLAGPDAQPLIDTLSVEFEQIQIRPASVHPAVVWSLSAVEDGPPQLVVVRIAAASAAHVRAWLRARLAPLQSVVGRDLLKQAI